MNFRLLPLILLASCLLAACTVFPAKVPPPRVTPPARFAESPAHAAPDDPARWWTRWNDPALTARVEDALAGNPDLREFAARVAQARAYVTVARSALYPTAVATGHMVGGGVHHSNPYPELGSMLDPDYGDPATDAHLAGIGMIWEPDVFGGKKAQARAAGEIALASEEASRAARVAVSAEAAANYLAARGLQERIGILDSALATLGETRRYVEGRFESGQATRADIGAVDGEIDALRSNRPALEAELDTHRRRLAILAGKPPEDAPLLDGPSLDGPGRAVPPDPPAALPSAVLDRRPDVRLRRDLLLAAAQHLTGAKTELLPRFGIEFFGGNGRLRFDGIPGIAGSGGLAALTVNLPIFTAGRLHAQIRAADARLDEAAAEYDRAVLSALGEVEDAYETRASLDRSVVDLAAQAAADRATEAQDRGLFEGGQVTLQDVLQARLRALSAAGDLSAARTSRALATVALQRALAGGW